jgi:asparagine synthase (glutamine-hydrolysing)
LEITPVPRLALRFDPEARPEELRRLADGWGRLLGQSARPVEVSRTVLPGFAVVNGLLGFLPNRRQPALSEDGALYLWLDGEIWDRLGAREAAGLRSGEPASDPELCLRLYEKHGDRFCERLNGQFVIALYDVTRQRLLLCNDRYGFRPLFFRQQGREFTCASEIKSLLAAADRLPEIDPVGVMELVAYEHELRERTLFRGIEALLPASRLIVEGGRVRQERYWRYRFADSPSRASEEDLASELAERLRTACARQAEGPGRVGLALSGGLDSRVIAAALPRHERRVAYTTGYPDSLDVLGARQIARACGMRHLHLVPEEGYLSRAAPEVVWRTEGAVPFFNCTGLQFHDRLRPELDIILAGHAGGDLSGQGLGPQPPFRRPDPLALVQGQQLVLPPARVEELFEAKAWRESWPEVEAHFRTTVEDLPPQRHLADVAVVWGLDVGEARFTNHSAQSDRYDFEVRAPMLDYDLVDFFLRVPYRYRFAQRLYKRTLARHFPEVARIPWAKSGGPVPGTPAAILWNYWYGGATRRIVQRVPALARLRKERVRSLSVVGDEMRRDTALRTEILDPFFRGSAFPSDLLEHQAARRIVEEHWSGARSHPHQVACLTTLALVYRDLAGGIPRALDAQAGDRLELLEAA